MPEEQPAEPDGLTDAQLARHAARKLSLTLPTREPFMAQVKDVCTAHPGGTPVYLKIADEGITLLLDRAYWVADADTAIEAFHALLGDANARLK